MTARRRATVALLAISLFAAGCGDSARDAAVDDFVEEGYTEESAICIVDRLESDQLDPTATDEPAVQAGIVAAIPECIRDDDLPGILRVDTLEEVETIMIEQMVGTGILDEEQARCVIAGVRDRGLGLVDINGMSQDPAAIAAVTRVTAACAS